MLPPLLYEVPVLFPWSSVLWRTHLSFPARCSLHHQYYSPSLVLFSTKPFGYYRIQVGRSLMQSGSPLVDFLLDVLDFSDNFLESCDRFWDTPNRSRI